MTKLINRALATCCAGAILLSFSACSKKSEPTNNMLTMNVPEEEVVVYTQTDPIDTTAWASATTEEAVPPLKLQDVGLEGFDETFPLVTLDTGGDPIEAPNELTSLSDEMILNSTAADLGDGTLETLVENELYRWTQASGFSSVEYTQPVLVAENRYMTHLQLKSEETEMEQNIFYTQVTDQTARIDRLWRSVQEDDAGSAAFDLVSNELMTLDTTTPLADNLS